MIKFIIALLAGILGSVLFTVAYNKMYHQSMGVIQIDELISGHIQVLGRDENIEESGESVAEKFSEALELSIQEVSEENNVTLFVGAATVSRLPDYTDIVDEKIKERLGL